MAGLMTDTYTYDSLANKYGNFHVPAIRLYVDGREVVQDMELDVLSLEISLSLSAASSAVFRLGDIYDPEKRSFDSKVKSKFKLGTIVEVGIGYVSEIQKVLKGFVALVGAEFGETPCLVVTVMDVRRLMMISGTHHVLHDVKNYSDAVKTILEEYSKLCKVEIDATNDNLERPLSQRSTDYDFITQELIASGRTGREFLVLGDTAYFRKPRKETRAICSMEFGRELLSFSMESAYMNLQIEVTGYNQQEQQVFTGSATAKTTEPMSSLTAKVPVFSIVDPGADTQDKANIRAQAYASTQLTSGQYGRGTCVGLPELVPGRFVEIVKLEDMVNKKYYVTSVTHRISEEGFDTEFEIGGWS